MECYICYKGMEYIETMIVSEIGMVKRYICNNCGKEVYDCIREE